MTDETTDSTSSTDTSSATGASAGASARDESTNSGAAVAGAPAKAPSYLVVSGFLGGKIDQETGEGLVQHLPGDEIALSESEAAVEITRGRIVPFDAARQVAIKAQIAAAEQGAV